jgi:phage terminase Nu1 subunit (DNA packaging protein)
MRQEPRSKDRCCSEFRCTGRRGRALRTALSSVPAGESVRQRLRSVCWNSLDNYKKKTYLQNTKRANIGTEMQLLIAAPARLAVRRLGSLPSRSCA